MDSLTIVRASLPRSVDHTSYVGWSMSNGWLFIVPMCHPMIHRPSLVTFPFIHAHHHNLLVYYSYTQTTTNPKPNNTTNNNR